jgi:hypothetical protein
MSRTGVWFVGAAVVPLDPSPVRGSHGRLPDDPRDGPVLLCSQPGAVPEHLAATEIRDLLLRLAGAEGRTTATSSVTVVLVGSTTHNAMRRRAVTTSRHLDL